MHIAPAQGCVLLDVKVTGLTPELVIFSRLLRTASFFSAQSEQGGV
jgi:hypothetical protein